MAASDRNQDRSTCQNGRMVHAVCLFLQVKGVHDRAVAEVGKWKCAFRRGESTTFASWSTEGSTDRQVELSRIVEWSVRFGRCCRRPNLKNRRSEHLSVRIVRRQRGNDQLGTQPEPTLQVLSSRRSNNLDQHVLNSRSPPH